MPVPTQFKNRILAEISEADIDRYFTGIELVPMPGRHVIYETEKTFEFIYFIESGVASVLTMMADGAMVEVGMVGTEGLVGISALLGRNSSIQHVVMQIEGEALRLDVASGRRAFEGSVGVRHHIDRFTEAFLNLSAQTAACNRLHTIEQRCARWLLMARDRIAIDTMPMTHEFLSSMLGVRRVGVTQVAKDLQDRGLIRYRRGRLQIVNHGALQGVACECYWVDHQLLNSMVR